MKLYEPAPPARKDELANVQDGIAIIVDGDTCPVAVESGSYAYIKNNTHGLAEGLYKNKSNSAFPVSGGTADSTVFEADSTGGLNALNASLIKQEVHSFTRSLSKGNNTVNCPSVLRGKNVIGVIVKMGDYILPYPPIFEGGYNEDWQVAIRYDSGNNTLTFDCGGSWGEKNFDVIYFYRSIS